MRKVLSFLFIAIAISGGIGELIKRPPTAQELADSDKRVRANQIAYENSSTGQKEATLKAISYRQGYVEEYMTKLGPALELEVFIQNNGNKPITNIEFSCWSNDIRGLLVKKYEGVVSEVIPANTSSEKAYKVSLGLVQTIKNWTYDCKPVGVRVP